MSNYAFNYSFNVTGNCNVVVQEISENIGKLRERVERTTGAFAKMEKSLIVFNQAQQYFAGLKQTLESTFAPGAALNASLADLQAISGATAKELQTVEKFARNTAKEFGVSAAGAVESYKLLLSQLSPELAENTEALDAMGRNVAILSKTMGGDTTAAAEVLTTAMNQYGVSLADPMEASRQMAEMMNIMAAAGREGSAELPTIKAALEQCGMAAKAAGVSFAETNAAIQVLDKAGKKGSEGGVALRNVMSTLAQGRFLPKDVREELAAAGVDIAALTDKSRTLTERLEVLKPVMADDALFSKLFGKENAAAALALVQGIPKVDQWTAAISGTNTAVEQSEIIMGTYNERLARVQARFDDFKISIFESCGDLGIWTQVVLEALIPLSQLVPLIWGASKAVLALRKANFMGALSGVTKKIRDIIIGLTCMDSAMTISGGYWTAFGILAKNVCRGIGLAIKNIPIIGWIAAGISLLIEFFQELWENSYEFRLAVFTAWETIKEVFNAIGRLGQKVKNFFVGIWEGIKDFAQKISDVYSSVMEKIRSWIQSIHDFVTEITDKIVSKIESICKPLVDAFRSATNAIKGFFKDIFDWIRDKFYAIINWFIDKYNAILDKIGISTARIARLAKEDADKSWAEDHPEESEEKPKPDGDGNSDGNNGKPKPKVKPEISPIELALNGVGDGGKKETDRVKNINITIDRLIDKFTISTTNLSESKERIKDVVTEALLSAVNDANYAL